MGPRADFYHGKGKDARWLGSIAWDGYRDGISGYILSAKREDDFLKAVEVFLASRDDATLPEQGWPWPWDSSDTTDCSYWFFDNQCWEARGYPRERYVPASHPVDDENYDDFEVIEFPDMSAEKNVALGERSGVILVTAGGVK